MANRDLKTQVPQTQITDELREAAACSGDDLRRSVDWKETPVSHTCTENESIEPDA